VRAAFLTLACAHAPAGVLRVGGLAGDWCACACAREPSLSAAPQQKTHDDAQFTPRSPLLSLPPPDLEWKLIYVGSAESEKYDQVLDSVLVGPVYPGQYRFVFQVRGGGGRGGRGDLRARGCFFRRQRAREKGGHAFCARARGGTTQDVGPGPPPERESVIRHTPASSRERAARVAPSSAHSTHKNALSLSLPLPLSSLRPTPPTRPSCPPATSSA
jgi:hypothetical protein